MQILQFLSLHLWLLLYLSRRLLKIIFLNLFLSFISFVILFKLFQVDGIICLVIEFLSELSTWRLFVFLRSLPCVSTLMMHCLMTSGAYLCTTECAIIRMLAVIRSSNFNVLNFLNINSVCFLFLAPSIVLMAFFWMFIIVLMFFLFLAQMSAPYSRWGLKIALYIKIFCLIGMVFLIFLRIWLAELSLFMTFCVCNSKLSFSSKWKPRNLKDFSFEFGLLLFISI